MSVISRTSRGVDSSGLGQFTPPSRTHLNPVIVVAAGGTGVLWLILGVAKSLSPAVFASFLAERLSIDSAHANLLTTAFVVVELLVGLGLIALTLPGRSPLPAFVSLCLSLAVLVYVLTFARAGEACGCFGPLVTATRTRRIFVAATLALLSSVACLQMIDRKGVRDEST